MKPALALLLLPLLAQAQSVVYKCPGPPVLYTDAISAKEAESKGCKPVEGAPVSVVQAPRRAAAPAAPVRSESPRASENGRIDPGVQKQRDNDRRSVLETELRQAESRLAELRREYADGNPERLGSERNYARYQERVSELKAALSRQEADVAALKRELAKLN
ncbi:hypothetical protein [Pseudorhodoferax sp.]|jgi:predicted RNase H-like nuclease (RuvC/YqgF family)|uniref:hypothetical protein n=1 Tax=Pseudorhodoferax sp. TaxID=1993553 RepID=UPI002DD62291|nr:hypothetical protein [Pseudorhodoferax sp.]